MKACKLRSWTFDHVPAEQTMFAYWRTSSSGSLVVDLDENARCGSTALYSNHRRKKRRLEQDFGRVEAELQTVDPLIFNMCLKWKSEQYRLNGTPDLFARPWARSLIEIIASQCKPEFSGVLSVLRAGGQPVAAHFGMRSGSVWHYWFPAYDPQFRRYSPGILLLLEMIAGAPKIGIKMIDFGKGDSNYKLRLANRKVPLIEGGVTTNKLIFHLMKSNNNLKLIAKSSPAIKKTLIPLYGIYRNIKTGMNQGW
jgi:CelD/BcsL family acetyltransferase involved in cellulose biosynthesis